MFKYLAIILLSLLFVSPALISDAQDMEVINKEVLETQYSFVKKRYSIDGAAQIIKTDTGHEIRFNESFKTKGGPDLKVYLSTKSLNELTPETVDSTSLKLGVLKSKKGAQSYIVPGNISLFEYKSVLIHCEAFTVLWGGFDL